VINVPLHHLPKRFTIFSPDTILCTLSLLINKIILQYGRNLEQKRERKKEAAAKKRKS
jgi:hypothetical protein